MMFPSFNGPLGKGKKAIFFFLFLYALFTSLMGWNIWHSRERELYLREKQLESNLYTLENHAKAAVEKVDIMLRLIQNSYRLWMKDNLPSEQIDLRLRYFLSTIPEADSLAIVDAHGEALYGAARSFGGGGENSESSLYISDGYRSLNVSSQSFFQKTLHLENDLLVISPPQKEEASDNRWMVSFSRPLKDEQGHTVGIVQVVIPDTFFKSFYANIPTPEEGLQQDSLISITDDRGNLLGRTPSAPENEQIGKPLSKTVLIKLLEEGKTSATYRSDRAYDGIERIFSYRKVGDYPLAVVAGFSLDSVLSPWKEQASVLFVNFLFISLLLFFLISIWLKHYHQLLRESVMTQNYDELTGLPKFGVLSGYLSEKLITAMETKESTISVFMLDIDHFRKINESYDYKTGNDIIRILSERFLALTQNSGIVGRYRDDEFIFILPELSNLRPISSFADALLRSATAPIHVNNQSVSLSVSIGISVYPNDGENPDLLFQNAETAMYHTKSLSHTSCTFFSQEISNLLSQKRWIESALSNAVDRREFRLFYQPQFHIQSRRLTGFEALIRWQTQEKGMIPPDQFINIAESTRLILPIGKWALEEACRQRKTWLDCGVGEIAIAVNLSAEQFRNPDLCQEVMDALKKSDLPARYLELEITETVAMDDTQTVIARLRDLRKIGVKISIDDFGTGYSSLSYLKRFPISKIKIDRSFVQDISSDQESAAIIEAIVSIAKNLHLRCIAEGVETEEQANILQFFGCHEVQGYLTGRPMPAEIVTNYLLSGEWLTGGAVHWAS